MSTENKTAAPISPRMKQGLEYIDPRPTSVISVSSAIEQEINTSITKSALRGEQLSWLPTETARTSIFSPVSPKTISGSTQQTIKTAWGKVEVSGPTLSIKDESVFLALLHEIRRQRSTVIKVNYSRICELLNISAQTKNFRRIKTSIRNLSKTNIDIELKSGIWTVERILGRARGNNDFTVIEVDLWFWEKFLQNEIVLLDLKFRQSLRGDIAKALYRFLSTHRGTQKYHTATLIKALNLDDRQPITNNRKSIKRAFNELKRRGFCVYRYRQDGDLFFDIKIIKKELKPIKHTRNNKPEYFDRVKFYREVYGTDPDSLY